MTRCGYVFLSALALFTAAGLSGCAVHPPVVEVRPMPCGGKSGPSDITMPSAGSGVKLRQGWAKCPGRFEATDVRFGWSPKALVVFAVMDDRRAGSRAKADNEKTWELGDAFEIFLRAPGAHTYIEIHVTPENHRLHLRYPPGGILAVAKGRAETSRFFMTAEEQKRIFSSTCVDQARNEWRAVLVIPSDIVKTSAAPIRPGETWRFSCARYDGDSKGTPAVLSASSPYSALNFHKLSEWGTLKFTK